ncbi:MAG: hypothetical protein ACK4FV_04225 [Candidatus Nitrosocaldus sp.]
MSMVDEAILMRYELKGYRLRRKGAYAIDEASIIANIFVGSTIIALILAVPTVAMLLAIYYVSNDVILASIASIALHYMILLFLVDWVSRRLSCILDDEEEKENRGLYC